MSNIGTWNQRVGEENTTETIIPSQSLPRLLEKQVARAPDATALLFEEQVLTYRDLNARANQLARHLQTLGVGPDVMVGLCIERSLEMFIGLLAIFKAGGVYVPMGPAYPQEHLSFMLDDTHTSVLLTQKHLTTLFLERNVQMVCLDADEEMIWQQSKENLAYEVAREQLAYVIYTSGSTGQPKGVLVSYAALASHCLAVIDAFELQADDHILQFSAITFDPSLEQVMSSLLAGAQLVIRGSEIWTPTELLAKVKAYGLTVINLTPAYWHLVAQEWATVPQETLPTSLRLVISGGDRLAGGTLRNWSQTGLRKVRVLNAYGPTEATITATIYDVDCWSEQNDVLLAGNIPIGHPLPHRKLFILDHDRRPVSIGVVGEFYIGGPLLARGYLNRPELTAECFIRDPFSTDPGARLYRTGDLVRSRADGIIEFVGRADQQVKIRCFRIELGEIEAALVLHEDVSEVVVLARENSSGDKTLVAYVVASQGKKLEVPILQSYLQDRLPEYMVPTAFVPMDALPFLPNGKFDRHALPEPKRHTEEESFVAPELLLQQQLAQIWEELLDVRPIGIKDNFFHIGGHSLLAARLVDRIEHAFGRRIALSALFSAPTIEQLADVLQHQGDTGARASILPVQVEGSKRPLFFLHGDWTGGAFYCFTLGRELGPEQPLYVLEPYKFSGLQILPSFKEVAAAHIEAMRTIQPEGPYLLGGFCNGGLFAYEMARQLEAAGERVDFLGLITPTNPVQFGSLRTVNRRIGLPFNENQQINLLIRVRHALRHIYRHLRPSSDRVQDFDQLLAVAPRLGAMLPPLDALYNDYVGVFIWIVSRYETGSYDGKITFYWASEEPDNEEDWRPVTRAKNSEDIEGYIIPGTHMSCVTDHIQELAHRFSGSLRLIENS